MRSMVFVRSWILFGCCLGGVWLLSSGGAMAAGGDLRPAADDQTVFGSAEDDQPVDVPDNAEAKSSHRSKRSPKPFWGESDSDLTPDSVSASGGIGVGAGYLGAELTLALGYGRYTDFLVSGYFRQESMDDQESTVYGPEVGIRFKLVNPTILTPFVGVGLGDEFWSRRDGGSEFDRNRSMTAYASGGVELRVTRGFAVSIGQKWVYYLERSPTKFQDHLVSESRFVKRTQIGFVVHF